eukprot:Unigene4784_Nuclearia_a/m.14626 Unigene4784_Nuclearia_a/g.14626  ORF Unigene4784_Nuclearia_a/g.14626 Unigene4784_Nuclearia_a/m.14626 type:complete len:383 (+) Unigene4784_Nuclearia_a:128-1276(+)
MTLLTASRKSRSVATFRRARMAYMPASVQTLRSSAPVVLGQRRAMSSKRMPRSQLMLCEWILRMLARPSRSGRLNSTRRSRRPGRRRAGSRVSGRLVAMRTLMLPRGSKPSSCVMSSSIVRWTSLSPPAPSSKRAPPMASTSSKKMMQAFLVRAISNSSRTMRAPSPTYFCTSSEPMTRMNVASVRLATARAHSVLPVPGGPYMSTPLGGSMPRLTKRSGCSIGISTTSRSFSICSLQPPTSLYVTSGFSSTCIIVTLGSILGGRGIWIWYFVRSTPTRMPSSMSVGATRSPSATTNLASCFTLITYLAGSFSPDWMILVQRATCSGCSSCIICLSAWMSHRLGGARPVSLSFTPMRSLTRLTMSFTSSSSFLISVAYAPTP